MVKYLASRKARELPAHCELDDLVSCGLLAIVEAVDRFDPAKGATFEQYAWKRVTGAIVDELRRQDRSPDPRAGSRARSSGRRTTGSRGTAASRASGSSPTRRAPGRRAARDAGELDRAHVLSLNTPSGRGDDQQTEIGETIVEAAGRRPRSGAARAREDRQFRRRSRRSPSGSATCSRSSTSRRCPARRSAAGSASPSHGSRRSSRAPAASSAWSSRASRTKSSTRSCVAPPRSWRFARWRDGGGGGGGGGGGDSASRKAGFRLAACCFCWRCSRWTVGAVAGAQACGVRAGWFASS